MNLRGLSTLFIRWRNNYKTITKNRRRALAGEKTRSTKKSTWNCGADESKIFTKRRKATDEKESDRVCLKIKWLRRTAWFSFFPTHNSRSKAKNFSSLSYLQLGRVDKLEDSPAPSNPIQLVSSDDRLGEKFAGFLLLFSKLVARRKNFSRFFGGKKWRLEANNKKLELDTRDYWFTHCTEHSHWLMVIGGWLSN